MSYLSIFKTPGLLFGIALTPVTVCDAQQIIRNLSPKARTGRTAPEDSTTAP